MMLWNKIKIAVAMTCVIGLAGTGAGWLVRGRAGAEAPTPAAKPPLNKGASGAAPPAPEEKTKEEIDKIHALLDKLSVTEEKEENRLADAIVEARLRVAEWEGKLNLRVEVFRVEEKMRYDRINDKWKKIAPLQETIDDFLTKESPSGKAMRERIEHLKVGLNNEKILMSESGRNRLEELKPLRKRLFQAEEALRRIENKQVRQREIATAKRDALLARLQQLEGMSLHLDPNNRLRELERKLDALRREVGELRRTLERPKER